jgi:hypothetical protein
MEHEGGRSLGAVRGGLESVAVGGRPWSVGAGTSIPSFGVYVLAVLGTLAGAALAGSSVRWSGATAALVFGGAVLLPATTADVRNRRLPRLALVALAACGVASLYLLATTGLPVRPYGDGAVLAQFVADGRAVPRWLLGSTAAATLHAASWELPSVQAWLPIPLRSASAFLSIVGTTVMVAGTWMVWRRWPGRLAVLLPACTPVYLLFSSGYVEYYPLIVPLYVATLAWLFDERLEARAPERIGLLAGLLPVVYLGFAPVAVCVLAAYLAARPAAAGRVVAVAAASAAVAVAACWPEGIVSFVRTLVAVINVGDAHLHPRYAGQVAGPSSMMFSWAAAASLTHLRDCWYLLVHGGGWWTAPLVATAVALRMREGAGEWPVWRRDARVWLGASLVGCYGYYFFFMVPRLGLTEDLDLFFAAYLLLPFLAGRILDGRQDDRAHRHAAVVLAIAIAALAYTAPALVSGTLARPH